MRKLLTILGVKDQSNLPEEILVAEQLIVGMQYIYENAPESPKKDALAKTIAETVRLTLQQIKGLPLTPPKKETPKAEVKDGEVRILTAEEFEEIYGKGWGAVLQESRVGWATEMNDLLGRVLTEAEAKELQKERKGDSIKFVVGVTDKNGELWRIIPMFTTLNPKYKGGKKEKPKDGYYRTGTWVITKGGVVGRVTDTDAENVTITKADNATIETTESEIERKATAEEVEDVLIKEAKRRFEYGQELISVRPLVAGELYKKGKDGNLKQISESTAEQEKNRNYITQFAVRDTQFNYSEVTDTLFNWGWGVMVVYEKGVWATPFEGGQHQKPEPKKTEHKKEQQEKSGAKYKVGDVVQIIADADKIQKLYGFDIPSKKERANGSVGYSEALAGKKVTIEAVDIDGDGVAYYTIAPEGVDWALEDIYENIFATPPPSSNKGDRPSPTVSANSVKEGTTMIGNDGQLYVAKKTKAGYNQWKRT